jgi:hypothetical protein
MLARMWLITSIALAAEPSGEDTDAPRFEAIDPKLHAWTLARRTRLGGVAMLGSGLALGFGGLALLPRADRDFGATFGAILGLETGAILGLYGATCLVIGHVMEDRALRGVPRPTLAGKAAIGFLVGSVAVAGVAMSGALEEEVPGFPYGWLFVGAAGSGLVLELVQMYDTGRPYGTEPDLSWTVVPTGSGVAVAARW